MNAREKKKLILQHEIIISYARVTSEEREGGENKKNENGLERRNLTTTNVYRRRRFR